MKQFINFGCCFYQAPAKARINEQTEGNILENRETESVTWFSMWFLASVATFGIAFFPMFYRMINSRNKHFNREAKLEKQIALFLKKQGKEPPQTADSPQEMNAAAWAASIILIVPVFIIAYFLSKDLLKHENHQDKFLSDAFPKRMFMPQTIPIKKYALISIVTFGVGGVYWLYKIVNNYNSHYKAQWKLEKEISRLMEENEVDQSM